MISALIVFGGWFFWISFVVLFVFEYQSVKRERGWDAFWALLAWIGLMAMFGNVTFDSIRLFVTSSANWWWIGKVFVANIALGVSWAVFRWVWRNAKRVRTVDRHVAEYLRGKRRKGTEIPDDLLEDWDNYVFGTKWLKDIQDTLQGARESYQRTNNYARTGVNDSEWLQILGSNDWNSTVPGTRILLEQARKAFLQHYDVPNPNVLTPDMRSLWLRRACEPISLIPGQPQIALLVDEPEVLKNVNMLGRWMAWWFVDIVIFFLGDLIHEVWLFIIHGMRGVLQKVAHWQYRKVRKNFRRPPLDPFDIPNDKADFMEAAEEN